MVPDISSVLTSTSTLSFLAGNADSVFVLAIKAAWAALSVFILPWLLSFVKNDMARRALFKGAEAFIRSLSEDLLQVVDDPAGFARIVEKFKKEHPMANGVSSLVEMALRAAINRLTTKSSPASVDGAKSAVRRVHILGA